VTNEKRAWPSLVKFLGRETALELPSKQASRKLVLLGNNVLAQVPDLMNSWREMKNPC